MTTSPLLEAMQRMPWRHVASKAIKIAGGNPRRGWRNTINAAEQEELVGANVVELERLYKEHLLVGEKYAKFYVLEPELANELRQSMLDIEHDDSAFSERYPLPLTKDELKEAGDNLQLMEVVRSDDGIGIIFCSRLTVSKREEFIVADWVDDNNNRDEILSQFSEVYGLRTERTQLYHVVWMPNDQDTLDIRVDFPDGMNEDLAHRLHSNIRQKFEAVVGHMVPSTPMDLMPAIQSLYDDDTDQSNVVELSFSTVTGSVKNEKMRQPRNGFRCLREELFHKSGVEALKRQAEADDHPKAIEPFRISVQWPVPADENIYVSPELTLATTTRGNGAGKITGVVIRNCLEGAQYLFIRDKLLTHLGF